MRKIIYFFTCGIMATVLCGQFARPAMAKKIISGVTMSVTSKNKKSGKVSLANAPGYKEALDDFNNKRFGPAAEKFEELDGNGYCCDTVHYYIAQCYHQSNQLQLAHMHYAWVFANSKDARLRYYAQSANYSLGTYYRGRTYGGQGNNFDKVIASNPGRSGGGQPWGSNGSTAPPPSRGFS